MNDVLKDMQPKPNTEIRVCLNEPYIWYELHVLFDLVWLLYLYLVLAIAPVVEDYLLLVAVADDADLHVVLKSLQIDGDLDALALD